MRRSFDSNRPSARKRGYDARWEATAERYKENHPWCLGCTAIGVSRRTEVVDHIVPHRGNQKRFWDANNWQPACAWHHNAIKPGLERQYREGKLTASELVLSSASAVKLTRAKHRPAIGIDGFAIPFT